MNFNKDFSLARRRLLQLSFGAGTLAFGSTAATGPVAAVGGDVVWSFEPDGGVRSSPTIIGDSVYIGSDDGTEGTVYALDTGSGDQRWEFETDVPIGRSSPAVAEGTVYITSDNLYALDAETGDEIWSVETGNFGGSSPTVADNTVFVGGSDDNVYAFDAEDGDEQWQFETGSFVTSSPTIVDDTVYIGSDDNNVYALDTATGDQRWEFPTEDSVISSPTVADGTVYVGSDDSNVYAIDAATGDQEWEFETGAAVASSPTVADGTVYVGSGDLNIYAINADTGDEQWRFETGGFVSGSPTVANGTVIIGSAGIVYAINATTGVEQWRFDSGATFPIPSSPTVVDGTVFIGIRSPGTVYALDAEVEGSSIDSRVLLKTLGHLNGQDDTEDPEVNIEVDTSSLEITPFPVQTGDQPTVRVEVENAEEVSIQTSLTDDSITLEEDSEGVWESGLLPSTDDIGQRVDLRITASNEDSEVTVTEYDNPYIQEETQIGYYTVNETLDTAVVYGQFGDLDPIGDSSIFSTEDEFEEWQQAIELDVNNYYGSPNGSMGAVGFSIDHRDNESDFYRVESRETYGSISNINDRLFEFLQDLFAEFTGDDVSTDIQTGEDLDNFIQNVVSSEGYDIAIGTHLGNHIRKAAALDQRLIYNYIETDRQVSGINTNLSYVHGVWYHELGHSLGLDDIYDESKIREIGIMDGEPAYFERVPVSTVSRSGSNNYIEPELFENLFGDNDEGRTVEWLDVTETDRVELDADTGEDLTVPALQGYELNDEVEVIRTADIEADPFPSGYILDYVIEYRPFFGEEVNDESSVSTDSEAVVIYRVKEDGETITLHTDREEDLLVSTSDSIALASNGIDPVLVQFTLEEKTGTDEDSEVVVNATPESFTDAVTRVAVDNTIELSEELVALSGEDTGITVPDLDLRAVDEEGRIVGKDPDSGDYLREIPGAQASGERVNGLEWIAVPEDVDAEFTVSSADIQQFIDEIQESDPEMEADDIEAEITAEYQSSQIEYTSDSELNRSDGRYTVTNTQIQTSVEQIDPGEEKNAVPQNNLSDIDISAIIKDVDDVDDERVTLTNKGESALDLTDWRLSNADKDTYHFPSFTLNSGEQVTVWTGSGRDDEHNLYWGRENSVWDSSGGRIIVRDDEDDVVLDVPYDRRGVMHYNNESSEDSSCEPTIHSVSDEHKKVEVNEKHSVDVKIRNGENCLAKDVVLSLSSSDDIYVDDDTICINDIKPSESVTTEIKFKTPKKGTYTIDIKLLSQDKKVDNEEIIINVK